MSSNSPSLTDDSVPSQKRSRPSSPSSPLNSSRQRLPSPERGQPLSSQSRPFLSHPPRIQPFDLQSVQAKVESLITTIQSRLIELATGEVPFLLPYSPSPDGHSFLERFPSGTDPQPLVSKLPDLDAGSPGLTDDFLFKQISNSSNRISVLLDVSGSGKTRHLYEALCLRFGFYFVGKNSGAGGSGDLNQLCQSIISVAKFSPRWDIEDFVEIQFTILIYSRWLLYCRINELFGGSLSPKQWLLMQAYPQEIFGRDIFANLMLPLMHIPSSRFFLPSDIPGDTLVFLDDAQSLPTDPIFHDYRSQFILDETLSTILSAFVSLVREKTVYQMVVAGTSVSFNSILETRSLGGCDKMISLKIRNLDGFYTRQQIASCLRTFLFAELAENEGALQYLFDRVRGRARFLVTVLTRFSERATHDLQSLKAVCREFVNETTSVVEGSLGYQICQLQSNEDRQHYFRDLSQLVFHLRYYSFPHPQTLDAQVGLLEYDLCRFVKNSICVSIDEPLVVLAYIRCIKPSISQSLLFDNIESKPFQKFRIYPSFPPSSSEKRAAYQFFVLWPLLRWLSGVPLTEFDQHFIEKLDPAVLKELFVIPQRRSRAHGAASSNSIPFSHILSLPFTIEHFDPLGEPACLSEVNRSEGGDDILEYFMRVDRPAAFYPHTRAGPDCVMILRFEDNPADDSPKEIYRVPLFIQFKPGRPSSIKAELKNLNPVKFYSTGPRERSREADILNERRSQFHDYLQKTFEGRWLGLLIMGGEVLEEAHGQVAPSGMAIATTFHQFLPERFALQVSKIEHYK